MTILSTSLSQLTFVIIGIALGASPNLELVESITDNGGKYLDDSCIDKCNVTDRRVDCNGCIPNDVYPTVNEIVVTDFNDSNFAPYMFCGVSWPSVHTLSIENENLVVPEYDINNFTFDCLHEIKTLKLKLPWLRHFGQKSLFGLENVMILDLTGCVRLEIPGLSTGLSLDASIPKLQTIILRAVGSAFNGIQLCQDIIDSLARRKVRNIDVSYTTVEFGKPLVNLDQLCECMKTMSFANSRIIRVKLEYISPCYSLRVLDLSGVKFPRALIPSGNITIPPMVIQFNQKWFPFISYVSVIYLNNLISSDHYIFIDNVTIHFPLKNALTELHLSGYSIPLYGLKFRLESNSLEYLDLSNNGIIRLDPYSFDGLIYLKDIDLSNNKLGTFAQLDYTFSNLFRDNSKLEIARLVQNELTYLPVKVFEFNTELKRIDLSMNKMMQITFEISHLYKLELLDLKRNAIEYLDDFSRQQIDIVYKNKQEKHNTTDDNSFFVDLRENVFSCKCHSMDFIKWFVHSPVFNGTKYLYYCTLDGKRTPMDNNAIEAAQYDCEKPQRKVRRLLLMVLLPCVSTGILVTLAIVAFKRYKRRKLYHRLRENIDLIHDDQLENRFPVFLSYASEDSEFVEPNILQPLKVSFNVFLRV